MSDSPIVRFSIDTPEGVSLRYAVIVARKDGQWLLTRHKQRSTLEFPGGHIEPEETPEEAARRELYEETGATDFDLHFVSRYTVQKKDQTDGGYLFFAEVRVLGKMPDFEMAEVALCGHLPAALTYPHIQTPMYHHIQAYLNLQSAADELWDVYDKERTPTDRLHRRGDPLPPGDYHIVVHVWLMNDKGEFLITKRTASKGYPLMWECTGGSALAGDDSLTAAMREMKEETGLTVLPENGVRVLSLCRDDNFCDVWLFRQNYDLTDVVLQPGETCDAMSATADTILKMVEEGTLIRFGYLEKFFTAVLHQSPHQ